MNNSQWDRAHLIAQKIHAADTEWTLNVTLRLNAIAAGDKGAEKIADQKMLKAWDMMANYGANLARLILELGPIPNVNPNPCVVIPRVRIDDAPSSHPGFERILNVIQERAAPDDESIWSAAQASTGMTDAEWNAFMDTPLSLGDEPLPDYLTNQDAFEQMAGDEFWQQVNHHAAAEAMDKSAEDEAWDAYNAAHRIANPFPIRRTQTGGAA